MLVEQKSKIGFQQGKAFPKLERSLDLIVKNKIHIDYVLFYQGSSDIGTKPSLYKYNLFFNFTV